MTSTSSKGSTTARSRRARYSPMIWGVAYDTISRRGRRHRVVMVRHCPYCGAPHQYRDTGLRRAACRYGYVIVRARWPRRGR